jgi:hypothetical protein
MNTSSRANEQAKSVHPIRLESVTERTHRKFHPAIKTAPTRPDRSRLSAVEELLRSITLCNQRAPESPRHSSFINSLSRAQSSRNRRVIHGRSVLLSSWHFFDDWQIRRDLQVNEHLHLVVQLEESHHHQHCRQHLLHGLVVFLSQCPFAARPTPALVAPARRPSHRPWS